MPRPFPLLLNARRNWGPQTAAAVVSAALYTLIMAIQRVYPFGRLSRNINDQAFQYLPMHVYLNDVLHGRAQGDILWSWSTGLGLPFLPDLATYVSSPLAVALMAVTPRSRVELVMTAMAPLTYGIAAFFMTHLLRQLRPDGAPWLAAALGVAYSVGSWAVDDASYNPMWQVGLAAVPMIAFSGLLVWQRRRPVSAVLLVALPVIANYYTAYMAILAGALIVLAHLVAVGESWRRIGAAALRWAFVGFTGCLLAMPLLLPVGYAALDNQPSGLTTAGQMDWSWTLVRFLPMTEGVGYSPGFTVASLAMIAALGLPFAPLPRRVRIVWTSLLVCLLISIWWVPTNTFWHLGKAPNGALYRQAFVVAAALVVIAWMALSASSLRRVWWGGAAVYGVLCAIGYLGNRYFIASWPQWRRLAAASHLSVAWAAGAIIVALLLGLLVGGRRRVVTHVAAVLAVVLMAVEIVVGGVFMETTRLRSIPREFLWTSIQRSTVAAVQPWTSSGDQWPRQRIGRVGPSRIGGMLTGSASAEAATSAMTPSTGRVFERLGFPGLYNRRIVWVDDDPVLAALTSVTGVRDLRGKVTRLPQAFPVVRTLQQDPGATPEQVDLWDARDRLTDAATYRRADVTITYDVNGTTQRERSDEIDRQRGTVRAVSATCPAGTVTQVAYLGAMRADGVSRLDGKVFRQTRRSPSFPSGGTVGAAGWAQHVDVDVVTVDDRLPQRLRPVACLDQAALTADVAKAQSHLAGLTLGGHSLEATFNEPQHGLVMVSTTVVDGWSCQLDGKSAESTQVDGFLAVRASGATRLSCRYSQPGLMVGAALAGVGVLLTLGLALVDRRRRGSAGGQDRAA